MKNPVEKILDPPKHLRPKGPGRNFWRCTLREFDLTEAHHLELLEQAASTLDRIEQARDQLEQDGGYFVDRWQQPKPHPALAVEKDNKVLFARLVRELGLDLTEPTDSRPPRQY